ncbi:lysine transporter LysE [Streptomyces sp. NPDC091268]|uniref:lysine transporter LysE n=1 Tax=Streptomyces sp. NPDC091268 TaxID=3365979 RepID=UPI0038163B2E
MSELLTPALAGAAAGLGVAMPMGAMSVLLLQEALRDRRGARVAAVGIATVDLGYAALATALGPRVASLVSPVEAWVRLASAAILLAIAARGLLASRRPARAAGQAEPVGQAGAAAGPLRVYGTYVALTAVNPTTALYFAALTTAQGASLRGGAAGAAFLGGVALASLLWQQALVAVGALAAGRISTAARTWTFRLGYGLVAAYALKLALPLP